MAVSEKYQLKMMIWTMGVVIVLGFAVLSSLLEPPYLYRHRIAAAQRRHLKSGRFPASIGSQLTAVEDCRGCNQKKTRGSTLDEPVFFPQLSAESYDLDLPCLTADAQSDSRSGTRIYVPLTVKQVRVRASACRQADTFNDVEISNRSNGMTATVFQPTSRTLLTDYITLTKTRSIMNVTFSNADGKKITRDFTIDHAKK